MIVLGVVIVAGCGPVGKEDGANGADGSGEDDGASPVDTSDGGSSESGTALPRACELLEATTVAAYVEAHRDVTGNGAALFLAGADGALTRSMIGDGGSDDEILVTDLGAERIAADATRVYWAAPREDVVVIGQVNVDGSDVVELAIEPEGVDALAVDAGDLYWITIAPEVLDAATLKVLRAGTTEPQTLLILSSSTLQLTAMSGLVYGVNGVGHPPGDGRLFAIDATGTTLSIPTDDGTVDGGLGRVHLTTEWTYWTSHEARLWRTPRRGGAPVKVYEPEDFECAVGLVRSIAGLGDDVYVATDASILRVHDETGETEVIAEVDGVHPPVWLGSIGDDLVWYGIAYEGDAVLQHLSLP